MKPYSDNFLRFDEQSKRYILTNLDLIENFGIDLQERLTNVNAINGVLNQISIQIYGYIHKHSVKNIIQDYIIATTEKGRDIIKRAMEQQMIYFLQNGDLSRSTDKEKRQIAIDENAKEILLETIPEINTSILYTGA